MGEFDRIVVTGDLFDNPKRADALVFENCRTLLEAKTGKKLIIVPGNHDERLYGNIVAGLGQDLSALVNLEWSSVIVDDDIKCIFYCFDSALEKEKFARGRVGVSQMKDVAKLFEKEAAIKPDIRVMKPLLWFTIIPIRSMDMRRQNCKVFSRRLG